MLDLVRLPSNLGGKEDTMVIDGISETHRGTWSRLTRLNTASIRLPMRTTRVDDSAPIVDERS
ncbi:hypothetical protein [Curtobacterium luteum]|uniref:hypothetical protein n=1 Tax=Curtobacterium luteum TaxID=33881 RepID=UPI00381E4F40